MGKVVDVLSRAARQCSIQPPSSWITATSAEHVEFRDDFLRATVNDLANRQDWPAPVAGQVIISGTGAETYALPSDFKRLQRHPLSVYDDQLDQAGIPVATDGQWVELKDDGTTGAIRYYRLSGYEGNYSISFYAEPTTSITVSYISDNWMATAGGVVGNLLTADTDVLLFPDLVVEAGIIWRWRERRGLPFAEKMSEFEALLARSLNDIRGLRSVSFGPRKRVRWQDRIPAFIPAS